MINRILIIICLVLLPVKAYGALDFIGGGTHQVTIGNIGGQNTGTVLCLVNPDSLTSAQGFWSPNVTGTRFATQGTLGAIRIRLVTDSTTANATSTATPLTAGTWTWVACTWDIGNSLNLYAGDAGGVMIDVTPVTLNNGAGNMSGGTLWQYGRQNSATESFDGRIAIGIIWTEVRTLAELNSVIYGLKPGVYGGLINYIHFGFNGVGTQADWSGAGNNGTVANSPVEANHGPSPAPFGG